MELIQASQEKNISTVKELLNSNTVDNIYEQNERGKTALFCDEPLIIKLILDHTTDKSKVNIQNNHSDTALSFNVTKNCLECVKILLDAGANPNTVNNDKYTPLMIALTRKFNEVAKLLISAGANIRYRTKKGNNMLMVAIRNRVDPSVIELMLEKDAEVNATNKSQDTPLIIASRMDTWIRPVENKKEYRYIIIKLLLKYGADTECVNNQKQTALSVLYWYYYHKKRYHYTDTTSMKRILDSKYCYTDDDIKWIKKAELWEYLEIIHVQNYFKRLGRRVIMRDLSLHRENVLYKPGSMHSKMLECQFKIRIGNEPNKVYKLMGDQFIDYFKETLKN